MMGEAEVKISDLDLTQPFMGWFPIVDSNQVRKGIKHDKFFSSQAFIATILYIVSSAPAKSLLCIVSAENKIIVTVAFSAAVEVLIGIEVSDVLNV